MYTKYKLTLTRLFFICRLLIAIEVLVIVSFVFEKLVCESTLVLELSLGNEIKVISGKSDEK
jgi:hypothetical protein